MNSEVFRSIWLEFENHQKTLSRIKISVSTAYYIGNRIMLEDKCFSISHLSAKRPQSGSLGLRLKIKKNADDIENSLPRFLRRFVEVWGGDPDTLEWWAE